MKVNFLKPYMGLSGLDTMMSYFSRALTNNKIEYKILTASKCHRNDIIHLPDLYKLYPKENGELNKSTIKQIINCDILITFNLQRREHASFINGLSKYKNGVKIFNRVGNFIGDSDLVYPLYDLVHTNLVSSPLIFQDLIDHKVPTNLINELPLYIRSSNRKDSKLKDKYTIKEDDIVFVFPTRFSSLYKKGHIYPRKGIVEAIRLFCLITEKIKVCKLLIAGSDEYEKNITEIARKELNNFIASQGGNNNIKFIEYEDCNSKKFLDILNISDFALHPNIMEREPLGNAAYEAMLAGCCLVTTKNFSHHEFFSDREIVLIDIDELKQASDKLIGLIENKKYKKIGNKVRKKLYIHTDFNKFSEEFIRALSLPTT